MLELWGRGYVEPVVAPPQPYTSSPNKPSPSLLQQGSLAGSRWTEVVGRLPVFAEP